MVANSSRCCLPVRLGEDLQQLPVLLDLLSSGNVLIAGASGSGKSTAVENLISQLSGLSPDQICLVLIDPKLGVEFALFQELPHLLFPVVDDVADAPAIFQSLLTEVVQRYRLFKKAGVRNLQEYRLTGSAMPAIVVVVEELADLLMVQHCDKELIRLAQIGRAAGVILLLITQRPSVDVLPGLLLANLSSRLAFRCSNRTNSLLVLDSIGAETLPVGEFLLRTPAISGITHGRGTLIQREQVVAAIDAARARFQNHSVARLELPRASHPICHSEEPRRLQTLPGQNTTFLRRAFRPGLILAVRMGTILLQVLDVLAAGIEWGLVWAAWWFRRRAGRLSMAARKRQR